MRYWPIAENRKQGILHLLLFLAPLIAWSISSYFLGLASGLQIGLILVTIIVSAASYVKQMKGTIEKSVERLPRIKTGDYVILPIIFDLKTWEYPFATKDPFTTLQFKLYQLDNGELSPADMEELLNKYFENPESEFKKAEEIALRTEFPARVDIEQVFLDPEGLRIKTNTFESTQLRRLAEQTMYKIHLTATEEQEAEEAQPIGHS